MNIRDYYRALDPDDVIRNDGLEYVKEGSYAFMITDIGGRMFAGSEKTPRCPEIVLTALVDTDVGIVESKIYLQLYRSLEWKLADFFRCIGLKKPGEPMKMDWEKTIGCTGRAYFCPESYFDKYNQKRIALNLVKFFDPPGLAAEEDTS